MAGIYVHIPFCRQACSYCDFHFTVNLRQKEDLIAALVREIGLRRDFFSEETVLDSLYFGGGTPGILSGNELEPVFEALHRHFTFKSGAEVTLEANPDDLSREHLQDLKSLGVNRLSIGIQSFREEDLRLLRRVHDARQALDCIHLARDLGFEQLTIDLIYGIPGLSPEAWEQNLETALSLDLPHISAYALTVEPQTLLARQVQKKELSLPEDARFEAQFFTLIDRLEGAGYDHYEISNFAQEGKRSEHNSSYWKGEPYLGLGPSAHSFRGATRSWNLQPNGKYIAAVKMGMIPIQDQETLSLTDRCNEAIMTQLRLREGINLQAFASEFGFRLIDREEQRIHNFLDQGWMQVSQGRLSLTRKGKILSDHIIAELFQEEVKEI